MEKNILSHVRLENIVNKLLLLFIQNISSILIG